MWQVTPLLDSAALQNSWIFPSPQNFLLDTAIQLPSPTTEYFEENNISAKYKSNKLAICYII